MTRRFHHYGVPTKGPLKDERHIPHLKLFVGDYTASDFGIEPMRFEPDADYPELVRSTPHLAFEVDDLEAELQGRKIIIAPNSPSPGLVVAFIEENGVPVELMQIDAAVFEG